MFVLTDWLSSSGKSSSVYRRIGFDIEVIFITDSVPCKGNESVLELQKLIPETLKDEEIIPRGLELDRKFIPEKISIMSSVVTANCINGKWFATRTYKLKGPIKGWR